MRFVPPRISSVALSLAIVPAVIALPVATSSRPTPHAVAPVVRTMTMGPAATSAVMSGPVQLVGASWPMGTLPRGTAVQVRSLAGGAWSDWTELEATDMGPDSGSADERAAGGVARTRSEPVWVGSATAVQTRVLRAGVPTAAPAGLRFVLVDGGHSDADAAVEPAAPIGGAVAEAAADQPKIFTRDDWGADESLRKRKCPDGPDYSDTIKVGFVHHTDTPNGYDRSDVPSIIRSIYAYHVKGNGWCDVGYNFLVDRFGRIWEGRYGGITKPVIGAHTGGFNTDAFGASAIGTFSSHHPSSDMVSAYKRLFAWKLGLNYRDPLAKDTLVSAGGGTSKYSAGTKVRFNVVSGHRNAGNTSCPGDALYAKLGAIRKKAAELIGASFVSPSLSAASDKSLGSGAFAIRAGVSDAFKWKLTVTNKSTSAVVKTLTGKATPTQSIATGWDRRDNHGVPVPKGAYILTLTGGTSSDNAHPFAQTVKVTAHAPARPPADVFGSGHSDLVTGAPGRDVNGEAKAGAVVVHRGRDGGIRHKKAVVLSQSSPGAPGGAETGDRFGSAVTTGDFNADGFSDIAVGIPGEDIGDAVDAGMVEVFPGGPDGPRTRNAYLLSQLSAGVSGGPESGDVFGAALAAGDVNKDGFDDLVVGVPGEGLATAPNAGSVTVVPGGSSGLAPDKSATLNKRSAGVPGSADADHRFGSVLAVGDLTTDGINDVAVGAPDSGQGTVTVLRGSASGVTGTGATAVSGVAVGNSGRFGRALAIGRFNGTSNSLAVGGDGGVSILGGSVNGIRPVGSTTWTQGTPGVPGTDEPGDDFGAALAAGDINEDGRADLAIAAPREDVGSVVDAGAVTVLYGSATGLTATGADAASQETAGVPGVAETGDRFGQTLGVLFANGGLHGDLVVGSPAEDLGTATNAGAVTTFLGQDAGLPSAADRIAAYDLSNGTGLTPTAADVFGAAFATD